MTAVDTAVVHEWRVVAPWWHWALRGTADPGDPDPGPVEDRRAVRVAAPVIQKYDSPDLVNQFLADPQHRLAFRDESDQVFDVSSVLGRLPTRTPTGVRKLFLASHHRHYLVVCSLHCDVAGFPNARRDEACEVGFVVRRRTVDLPDDHRRELGRITWKARTARQKRAGIERQLATMRLSDVASALRMTTTEARLRSARRAERDAVQAAGARLGEIREHRVLEGWRPVGIDEAGSVHDLPGGCAPRVPGTSSVAAAPLAGIGRWGPVDEVADHLDEATYPLSPLVPDPTKLDHDAAGETIYFGVVPTGSSDVDPTGCPRYNDRKTYEIRCFVRRHRLECPRDGHHCGCPVTWSEPTEPFRLASHFDLEGTANRPVTVQLPDLAQLQADALRLAPGGAGGVRFQSPPGSALNFTSVNTDAKDAGRNAGFQICSFSIPLITIVAFFVFSIFLPIVVFVFQLWFLLALRFCIPPDVSLDAGMDAELDALGPGLEIDAGVAASIAGDVNLLAKLKELLNGSGFAPRPPVGEDPEEPTLLGDELKAAQAAGTIDDQTFAALVRASLAQGPTPPPDLVFARRVERAEVVRP